jgi:hypothetical protein
MFWLGVALKPRLWLQILQVKAKAMDGGLGLGLNPGFGQKIYRPLQSSEKSAELLAYKDNTGSFNLESTIAG